MPTLFAMLEDAGYRRHEIGKLSRGYIRAVLFHKREEDGRLVIPRKKAQRISAETQIRQMVLRRKLPLDRFEAKVRELLGRQRR